MMEKIDVKILYLCIHKRMDDLVKRNRGRIIKKDILFNKVFGEIYHIPYKLRHLVLKEMERMNMVEESNEDRRNSVVIKPLFTDPEENVSEFYRQLKMF